ncbi:hypothetical protein K9M74_01675 [Candidatus Woesearchaeota archaeon]|nr:hypothetical protein [Candidatus Woesearchaeota archaeon]
MDIHITYETLFDLLRKERSLEELQDLDKQFWLYVIDYLKERQAFFDKTSAIEQEKMRIQLSNIKRILKEIYERREQKILQLALNVIRTDNSGFVDTRNMLYEERLLFDESLAILKKYKEGVLDQVFVHEAPIMATKKHAELAANMVTDTQSYAGTSGFGESSIMNNVDDTKLEESVTAPISSEETVPEETNEQTTKASLTTVKTKTTQTKQGTLLVKFVTPVPKFLGKDKEVFGPYNTGTITSLPENIAAILLKKDKVQKVIAE